jgi:hypothetical protein
LSRRSYCRHHRTTLRATRKKPTPLAVIKTVCLFKRAMVLPFLSKSALLEGADNWRLEGRLAKF